MRVTKEKPTSTHAPLKATRGKRPHLHKKRTKKRGTTKQTNCEEKMQIEGNTSFKATNDVNAIEKR